jgi:hypothetical protein
MRVRSECIRKYTVNKKVTYKYVLLGFIFSLFLPDFLAFYFSVLICGLLFSACIDACSAMYKVV